MAMWDMLAGHDLLFPWETWLINSGPSGCEEENGSSACFCSSNRAVFFFKISSNWMETAPRNNLRTELNQTGRLSESFCMDRRYLPGYFTYTQKHTWKWGTTFNWAAQTRDRKMFRKQHETNAERETLTLSAAPRNWRAHLQVTKTHARWQQKITLSNSGTYL
jgi:hypothetical protein